MSKLNVNYTGNGISNNGQNLAIVRVDSVPSKRKDGTISKKVATFNAGTQSYSVPSYGFVLRSDASKDGLPSGQRASAQAEFRVPVALDDTDLDTLIADFRAFVNDPDLKDNIVRLVFPCQTCAEE